MRKLKVLSGALVLTAVVALGWAGFASAHSFHSGSNVTVDQAGPIEETVFAAGRTVNIDNEVYGDVFCAGQNVTVSGVIHGDVICAGQSVHVTGTVEGDVRLAGQTVTLGAQVAGNATIAGQSFVLESSGRVDGDVSIGSADATLNGPVGRDLAAGGENVTVASTVGRNIKGSVNNLVLSSNARVGGDVEYTSKKSLQRAAGAEVAGEVTRTEPAKPANSKNGAIFGFSLWWFGYWFLAMLLTAMAIALLFPQMLNSVTNKAMPRPWKALLVGLLALVAVPALLAALAVSVVGIPLAFTLALLWCVVLLLSGPLFGYYLGRLMLKKTRNPLLIMLVGASVLLVLYFIPIIGGLALFTAVCIGSGMVLLEVFKRTPKPRYTLAEDAGAKAKK